MSDDQDAVHWAVPAITLGYAVQNDERGRFRFFTADIEIIYRCGKWIARDIDVVVDPVRQYPDLKSALIGES